MAKRKLLLIGWDAADWKVIKKLIEQGDMPHTESLVDSGVMGNLATLKPVFSPMLWTSIATGMLPGKHGIHGFYEPDPSGQAVRPISNLSRKTKAIWNILNQNGLVSNVVGWWPSHPAEPINGVMVSNLYQQVTGKTQKQWRFPDGTVHPPRLNRDLFDLRIHPSELSAEDILPFVPKAAEVDQESDHRLSTLAKVLCECTTIHSAATAIMQLEPWDFMAVYYDAIDHFSHGFMQYHPPKLPWVDQQQFEIYQHVVEGAYKYHDMMLGTLLKLAGDDTTVMLISDHGFHSDHLRPASFPNEPAGPAAEHRDYGIFVLNGPGIKKDEIVFGATLLDIAPTILSLFDLPIGRDMDGKVLESVYQQPANVEFIDSWEDVAGDDGQHPADTTLDPEEASKAIEQLVELGYIDQPSEDKSEAIRESRRELQDNLGRSLMFANQHKEAIAVYAELWNQWPDETRFGLRLLGCYIALRNAKAARQTLEQVVECKKRISESAAEELRGEADRKAQLVEENRQPSRKEINRWRRLRGRATLNTHALMYYEAQVLELEGEYDAAIERLRVAAAVGTSHRGRVLMKLADLMARTRRPREATKLYEQVLELDPESSRAWIGISRCHFRMRQYQQALKAAESSTALIFHSPLAHYWRARSLYRLKDPEAAIKSLKLAIQQNPNFPMAHRVLANIYRSAFDDLTSAKFHQRIASELRTRNRRDSREVNFDRDGSHVKQNVDLSLDDLMQLSTTGALSRDADVITVVSGLPRSGTSMMMQMVRAAGMPVMTDGKRKADQSNQRGYFEYEPVKSLASNRNWVSDCYGKAVKVVAPLVPLLPLRRGLRYRFIFMLRDIHEVLDSQETMIARLKKSGGRNSLDLAATFSKQLRRAIREIENNPHAEFITIDYSQAISDPFDVAEKVIEFLNLDADASSVAKVISTELYRSRKTDAESSLPDGSRLHTDQEAGLKS